VQHGGSDAVIRQWLSIFRIRVAHTMQHLRAVRFWGHDGAMEASFFVNQEALQRIQPSMRFDEEGLLRAFDRQRDLIHATATKVYRRGPKALYELAFDDF
jgi:hypothetical protein